MGNPYIGNAATFLVHTVFGVYILVVMLRFLFQLFRADFYNPFSQLIVKLTNPALRPLRRVVPSLFGIDTASIVLMAGLKAIELWLVHSLVGAPITAGGLAVLTVAEVLALTVNVFLFSILILVVISWVNPGLHNPIVSLLTSLTAPIMRPLRRRLPPASGLDFSPMLAMMILVLMSMLVVAPMRDQGRAMMRHGSSMSLGQLESAQELRATVVLSQDLAGADISV